MGLVAVGVGVDDVADFGFVITYGGRRRTITTTPSVRDQPREIAEASVGTTDAVLHGVNAQVLKANTDARRGSTNAVL